MYPQYICVYSRIFCDSLNTTLNSKRKYTLIDVSGTQRVMHLPLTIVHLRLILGVPQSGLDGKGSFLLSTRKITMHILSFRVECIY